MNNRKWTFDLFNRRLHLYLALTLMPWFLMYGVSSLPFSHHGQFQKWFEPEGGNWSTLFEKEYTLPISSDSELREIGKTIMEDNDFDGAFGVYRGGNDRINVYIHSFWDAKRLTYFLDQNRLRAEDKNFRFDHFLTGMHARGGFQQDSILNDAWAVIVDVVCVAMLVWIASGIYMWWKLRRLRKWGSIALGGGMVSFAVFLWIL